MNFEVADITVAGKYFQKWGPCVRSFVLLKDLHLDFLHSHLVRTVKFLILPRDYGVQGDEVVYEMTNYACSGIQQTIAALDTD